MKIKRLRVDGFRCLKNCDISFEEDITLIIGENDSGKTSLVDCLKIITQNQPIEIEDFYNGERIINLEVETGDFKFERKFEHNGEVVNEFPLVVRPTQVYLQKIKDELESTQFDISNYDYIERLKNTASIFGFQVRSNTNLFNLKDRIIEKITSNLNNQDFIIENTKFPQFNNIQLDGKHFEDVNSFFHEVFIREKQSAIWNEQIESGKTIEEIIKEKINKYSEEISTKIDEKGIKEKIRLFLRELSDIRIEPKYSPRDINIEAKVKFLEKNGEEIYITKKGDGTKRRITMALLEYKKDEAIIEGDNSTIYILDEPDTHLHVKAQIELLDTLQAFSEKGDQIILTSHSPFLMNSVKPHQIRMLAIDNQNCTNINYLHDKNIGIVRAIQSIGIENVYLFFAKIIIIVEGETEEKFIPTFFLKNKNKSINSCLIKIINSKGIHNIYGFAKGILELHDPENIIIVFDNDASDDMRELIEQLELTDKQIYIIGTKEFEDAFSDQVLFECWKKYLEECDYDCPPKWSVEGICQIRKDCIANPNLKFSSELKKLNVGGKKMTKPIFGYALANYIDDKKLPPRIKELFTFLP